MNNDKLFFIATADGKGVKVNVPENDYKDGFDNPEDYIKLENDDFIVSYFEIDEMELIFCITKQGFGYRFNPSDIRIMGKGLLGVSIIKLENEDLFRSMPLYPEDTKITFLTESKLDIEIGVAEIPILQRGSKGVRLVKFIEKDDSINDVRKVFEEN